MFVYTPQHNNNAKPMTELIWINRRIVCKLRCSINIYNIYYNIYIYILYIIYILYEIFLHIGSLLLFLNPSFFNLLFFYSFYLLSIFFFYSFVVILLLFYCYFSIIVLCFFIQSLLPYGAVCSISQRQRRW